MDTVGLLKEFAKLQNIDTKEVDKFLIKKSTPTTLEELTNMPSDMRKHWDYITRLHEPLKEFVKSHVAYDRYETIELGDVINSLEELKSELEEEDFTEEVKLQKQTYFELIESEIIKCKFGSVLYDW